MCVCVRGLLKLITHSTVTDTEIMADYHVLHDYPHLIRFALIEQNAFDFVMFPFIVFSKVMVNKIDKFDCII